MQVAHTARWAAINGELLPQTLHVAVERMPSPYILE
jgi:hypothetical protein